MSARVHPFVPASAAARGTAPRARVLARAAAALALAGCAAAPVDPLDELALVYRQPFAAERALADFDLSDPTAWRITEVAGRPALELLADAAYEPPVRSPRALALLADHAVGDCVLEVDVQQTGREYGHRDLCVVLGWQSPTRFYYVHLASSPDEHAHNVFVVDDALRVALAPVPARGVDWGAAGEAAPWRRVRVERRLADGAIRVLVDGALVLEAFDARFAHGRVGVGSFDDRGRFADLRLFASEVRAPAAVEPFPRRE